MSDGELAPRILESWDDEIVRRILQSAQAAHEVRYREADWFRWKFFDSPYGPAVVCYAEAKSGEVAGVVAYGMWRLTLGERDVRAAVSYETFVHPSYRGRGLFLKLAERAATQAASRGAEVLFNFPNPASRPGFAKLGWRDMGGIQTWVRPLAPLRVAKAVVRQRSIRLGALLPDACNGERLPETDSGAAWLKRVVPFRAEGCLASARTWELLRWRFLSFPTFRYLVADHDELGCIYRVGTRNGLHEAQLMDVLPTVPDESGHVSSRALRELISSLPIASGFDVMSAVTTGGAPLADALPGAGFVRVPNRASFMCLPLVANLEGVHKAKDWALTTTDIHTF